MRVREKTAPLLSSFIIEVSRSENLLWEEMSSKAEIPMGVNVNKDSNNMLDKKFLVAGVCVVIFEQWRLGSLSSAKQKSSGYFLRFPTSSV